MVKEEQHMTQGWIWSILCACVGVCGWGIIRHMTLQIDSEGQSISTIYMFWFAVIPCLILVYFYRNKLYTSYDQEGIKIKYFPFGRKLIRWNEIKRIELVEMDLFTHSVWRSKEHGMVYNAKGNTLLKIETESENMLIGTSLPNEIRHVVNTYYYNT
ncbi:MAG TPA: hypothetical protein VK750_08770 [Cytophagaceae bacterium]|jgi:hypothetical protein|nr:hypothetical protein [Cytophagaceae bacterium]